MTKWFSESIIFKIAGFVNNSYFNYKLLINQLSNIYNQNEGGFIL
jgi:hypothetical protein